VALGQTVGMPFKAAPVDPEELYAEISKTVRERRLQA
jgi:hypothetical protein